MIKIGVLAIVLNNKNQVLLGRRVDNKLISLPGGKLEFGESFKHCAVRELKEECNIDSVEDDFLEVGVANVARPQLNFHSVLIMMSLIATKEQEEQVKNLEPDKCEGLDFYDLNYLLQEEVQKDFGHALKEFLKTSFNNDVAKFIAACKKE